MPSPRRMGWATGVMALAVALCGACAGTAGGAAAADTGLVPLKVAALSLAANAPAYIAQEDGYFARNGLAVTIVPVQQSTAAVSGMLHGTEPVILGANYVSFFRGQQSGTLDIRILTDSQECVPGGRAVLVAKNSHITKPSGLAGQVIGVNVVDNISTLILNEDLSAMNVPAGGIRYVAVPFAGMGAALRAGRIAAAFIAEPFLTRAEMTTGARVLFDPCQASTLNLPLSGSISTARWVDAHPVEAAEFRAAMYEAQARADTDQQLVREVTEKYFHVSPMTGSVMNIGTWPVRTDATQLQRLAGQMFAAGMLRKRLDAGPLIFTVPGRRR